MIFELALVVRAALAKAYVALNHASAEVTSQEAKAELVAQYFASEVSAAGIVSSERTQELTNTVNSLVLGFAASLDEHNLWPITYGIESVWDYQTFEDELVSALASALNDAIATVEDVAAHIVPPLRADSYAPADGYFAALHVYAAEGVTPAYFAGNYAAQDYGVTDNFTDDRHIAALTAARADAFTILDIPVAQVSTIAEDMFTALDAAAMQVSTSVLDSSSTSEVTSTSTSARAGDSSTIGEVFSAATQRAFADGITQIYFSGDYAAQDYGVTDNYAADMFSAALGAVAADTTSATDAATASTASSFSEGAQRTYFAADYAASDYNATENSQEESLAAVTSCATSDNLTTADATTAAFLYPPWADFAVPADSIAIAITVASQDSLTTADATSATIQSYALDHTYFSGDYATLPY